MIPFNLRHFHYFHEVARCGSFTRAARELMVSQSALSVQIRTLEDDLGVTLFDRHKGGVELTEAGRVAWQCAEHVFGEIERMVGRLRESGPPTGGTVAIATVNSIGIYVLPPVLRRFRDVRPGVDLRVDFQEGERVVDRVLSERSDLAIVPWSGRYAALEGIRLARVKMFVVVSPDHRLAQLERVSPRELEQHPFVGYQQGMHTRAMIDAFFRRLGISIEYGIESANAATIKHMVMAGMGVGVLPEYAVSSELRRGQLVRVRTPMPTISQDMMLYRRRNRTLARASADFVDFVTGWFEPRARDASRRGGADADEGEGGAKLGGGGGRSAGQRTTTSLREARPADDSRRRK